MARKPWKCRLRLHEDGRENRETHERYEAGLRCNAYRDSGRAYAGEDTESGITGTGTGGWQRPPPKEGSYWRGNKPNCVLNNAVAQLAAGLRERDRESVQHYLELALSGTL
jgi:hypothetical protein